MKDSRIVAVCAVISALLLSACSHPTPVASLPAPRPAADLTARDSVLAARRARPGADSIAAKAQAEAFAKSRSRRLHADSVRSEVQGEVAGEAGTPTVWGLGRPDSAALADQLHFGFNVSELTPADLQELESKRQVLVAHPDLTIQIAGNCDERGPDEYNLALGERRAAAAKRWLVAAGIAASRIGIVSYGEERPLDPGHDEAAWAKNRRDEFVVTHLVSR